MQLSEQPEQPEPAQAAAAERFEQQCHSLVAPLLMRPLRARDGIPERQITAAERALGLRLPTVLRRFYRLVGRREELTQAHNCLAEP